MPQSIAYFKPGQDVTGVPTADVEGARFVVIAEGGTYNQPRITAAGADALTFGVTGRDAKKDEPVHVHVAGIVPVTAGAAITAGASVSADANGAAVTASAGPVRGIALADAAEGDLAAIHLV